MRLRRLLIEQYGNFERLDLPLAAEPGRINLVVAPNGAGKSMLRRAFHDLLFGYKTEAKLNYRYKRGLNLQAEALTAAGEPFAFGWRHPSARYFDPDHPDAAARFNTALGGIKPPQLEHLFALDTVRLREGGEELARGGDSLGLALLSGTGELMSAKAARATLAARRDQIWAGTRQHGRPLARAAKSLEEARRTLRSAVQLPVQRAREISALDAETAKLNQARETHAAMQAKAARLARIDRTRRFLEEHRAALAWLEAHPDAPVLTPNLADDLATARQSVSLTTAKRTDAQQALTAEEDAAASLALDHAALTEAHALDAIHAALERIEQASGDIVTVRAEQAGHLDAIAQGLRDLGANLPVWEAATLLPRRADEATARQLIKQYASRVAAQDTDRRRVRQAQDALDQIEREMLTPPAALEALASLMRVIRADRDPATHLTETAHAHTEALAAAIAALGAIPGWSGTMATLQASKMPPLVASERLDQDRAAAATALKQAETECDHLARERDQWTRQLREMDERPLPSSSTIADRRAQRDKVWALIYRKHFAGEAVPPAEVNDLLGTEPLELALPRLIHEADQLVDWRLQELPRAKEQERITKELDQSAASWERLTAHRDAAQCKFAAAEATYGESCTALGLEPQASLADIRHALSQRAHALAAGQAAATAADRHQAVLDLHAQWATQLRSLLPGFDALPFSALFIAADAQLRAADEASAARIRHDTQRRSAAKVLADAQSDLQASEQALTEWAKHWAQCLQGLGRPTTETPAATEAVLQCLTDLASAYAAATSLGRRIDDMHRAITTFTDAVTALATSLGVADDADVFARARILIARHEAAQRQRTLAEAAKTRLQKLTEALRIAAEREREARQALDAIIAACSAVDGEDADRRIAASRERARQEALRDAAAAGLAQHGDGLPLAELQADADSVTADQAATERTQTQHALAEARDASEAAAGKVRDLQQTMEHAAEATTLSESVHSQEAAAATFGHLLDDYLVLSLAEQMLVQSVAAVEAKAGSSGVTRIAAAFARVTNGDYTIDGEEGPDGKTILVALERQWPNERKALSQLSEGTRDQLYLALRIVAIEDHAAAAPALPFLADDILQTFDDTRALAALRALLDLSQHTQVIVLTHHPHVAALAEALPPGSVNRATL